MFDIRKKDKVVVISGKDKGKKGEVREVLADKSKVVVTGVNIVSKHEKTKKDKPGGIVKKEAPIHISKVMIICPKCGKPARIGKKTEGGEKLRTCKKCAEIII